MKNAVLLLLFCLSAISIFAQSKRDTKVADNKDNRQYSNTKFEYVVIDAPNKTFGYDISAEGKTIIHQASIPGFSGDEGFRTKNDAQKVARLAIAKIQRGEMPPTITPDELKKLNLVK